MDFKHCVLTEKQTNFINAYRDTLTSQLKLNKKYITLLSCFVIITIVSFGLLLKYENIPWYRISNNKNCSNALLTHAGLFLIFNLLFISVYAANYNLKGKESSFLKKIYNNDVYINFYFAFEFVAMNFLFFFQKLCCGDQIFKTFLVVYIFMFLQLIFRFILGLVYTTKIYSSIEELLEGKKTTKITEIKLSDFEADENKYTEKAEVNSSKTFTTFNME